jgi:hypothetical protein
LFHKKKEKLFFTVFFQLLKRAVLSGVRRVEGGGHKLFLAREQKDSGKKFFLLWDMKFCFMKRFFYTALEETRSVGSQKKSAVVAGRVLNFGTKEGTTSFEPIERPITCVSALYDARKAS